MRYKITFSLNGEPERAVAITAPEGEAETALLKAGVALVRAGIVPVLTARTDLRVTNVEARNE